MPFGLGVTEFLVILVLLVLFFGAKRIPGIARGLGEGIRKFKREVKEDRDRIGGDDEERRS